MKPHHIATHRAAAQRRLPLAIFDYVHAVPAPAEVTTAGEAWRPHRTTARLYRWRSLAYTPQ